MNTPTFPARSSLLRSALAFAAAGALVVACGGEDGEQGGSVGPGAFQGTTPGSVASSSGVSSNQPGTNGVGTNGSSNGTGVNPGVVNAGNPSPGVEQGQTAQTNGTQNGDAQNGGSQNGQGEQATEAQADNNGAGGSAGMPMGGAGGGTMEPVGAAGAGMEPVELPEQPETGLPAPPGQAFFFDDFEAGAAGSQPGEWQNWINYTTETNNTADRPQFALLDDTESYTGNQSVHFHAEGATQPAMLTRPLPAGTNSVYIRAYVKTSIQVGGVQPDAVSNHETLIGLRAEPGNGNDEIRFGGAKGALGFNMVGPGRNDAVAPLQAEWGSGPGMTPNEWHCVEIAYLNDGAAQATATLDGAVVRTVDNPGGWHIPVDNQWLNGLFNEVFIGWQSFSNAPANDVWMDDLVLSTQPVGCD